MLRKGITDFVVENQELSWVGSAENGRDALVKIRSIIPDIAILDIEKPHMTGIEVAKQLISESLPTKFIIMTLFKDEVFLKNAMAAGIKGYLLKESNEKELLECIMHVSENKVYVNSSLTYLLYNLKKEENSITSSLSKHALNILKLIAKHKTTSELADMSFISPKTVSNHRNNISKKLNLKGVQNGLLKWAIEHKDLLEK